MRKYFCVDPWFGMCVAFHGNMAVNCCHYQFSGVPWQADAPLRLTERFNDPFFQQLRSWQLGATLQETGCSLCENSPVVRHPQPPATPEWLNASQTANYLKALTAWRKGAILADYSPTSYIIDFGRACNLNCTMCTQTDVRRASKDTGIPIGRLLAEEETIALASHVLFFGGEPLHIKESREFLEAMLSRPALRDVGIEMVTNGYFLPDFLDKFTEKPRIRLLVSLDATSEHYERVRRGSNWKRVSSAVKRFAALKARPEHRHWELVISAVVMKTTLPDLPNLVRFALDMGASLIFYPCHRTRHNAHEDIFGRPELLPEIPNWQSCLDETAQLLDSVGNFERAQDIRDIRTRLEHSSQEGASPVGDAQLVDKVENLNLNGKRVMIWGTGSYYRLAFQDWLAQNRNHFDFLGFVDNNSALWGKTFEGARIMSPTELSHAAPDVVILASAYKTSIATQLKKLGLTQTEVA